MRHAALTQPVYYYYYATTAAAPPPRPPPRPQPTGPNGLSAAAAARDGTGMGPCAPVTFVTRPRAGLGPAPAHQPSRPPWRRAFGSYCLKAQCPMYDAEGRLVGRVMGYDRYMTIQEEVEHACRLEAGRLGVTCGEARLTLLRDHRKECSGEVYFVLDDTARRLL